MLHSALKDPACSEIGTDLQVFLIFLHDRNE